ncbi:hypothetical protein [Streptomyces sp. NPDC048603]|uniref:hypothetical protein n=1 Tax=Streptomyces sp. NPDC048603 TaxID=3365577 RepID=UPI00371D3FAF
MAQRQEGAGDRDGERPNERPNERRGERPNERPKQRGPVFAALTGALIGALAGLTGSMLAYFEARDTHRYEAQARRADIRRAAYVDLAAATNKYEQETTQLLSLSLDPAKSQAQRDRQFEEKYAPANTDLARALATARLVTARDGRRGLEEVSTRSTRVGEIATHWYGKGPEGADRDRIAAEFADAVEQQGTALQTFMDRAADEAL